MSIKSNIGKLKRVCPAPLFRALQRFANRSNIKAFNSFAREGINSGKIVFLSPTRRDISGNFAFVLEALKEQPFETVVLLEQHHENMDEVMHACATARYIFADDYVRYMYTLPLAPEQKFIQLWHSTGAFKRMGFSRMGREGSTIKGSLTHRNYTDVVVSSEGVVDDFAEAFGVDRAKVHPYGVPRTDIFFDETYKQRTRARLREEYQLGDDQRVVLFAPTYRGNDVHTAYYPPEFIDFDVLSDALGDEYVLAIKYHPFIKDVPHFSARNSRRIINVSNYREINDLLLMADVLVTDYSSVIFEYAFLDKPVVFFAPDKDEYVGNRDFFYDYGTYLYGTLATTQKELCIALKSCEARTHNEADQVTHRDLANFKDKFLGACDGKSTERCVQKLLLDTSEMRDER